MSLPPLHQAILRGDLAEVQRRLTPFVGFSTSIEEGWMPLHVTVLAPPSPDRYRIMEEILHRTCCVGTTDLSGRSALDLAEAQGDEQAIVRLRAVAAQRRTNTLGI